MIGKEREEDLRAERSEVNLGGPKHLAKVLSITQKKEAKHT